MSDKQDIRRALEKRLNAGAYTGITNSTDIAWENKAFDPTAKSAWLRPNVIFTERDTAGVGVNAAKLWRGLFLVDCFLKNNTGGTAAIDDLGDDIISQFDNGTVLTENSNRIHILSATHSGGIIPDNPWILSPITITWYSYIA